MDTCHTKGQKYPVTFPSINKPSRIIIALPLITACLTQPSRLAQSALPRLFAQKQSGEAGAFFVPKFEIAGNWNSDHSREHSEVVRHGRHVSYTFNTAGYTHCFEGKYINDHTVEGIQARRSRADGTTTRMRLIITLESNNLLRADWVVLDSNSDLRKGQTGTAISRRVIVPAK